MKKQCRINRTKQDNEETRNGDVKNIQKEQKETDDEKTKERRTNDKEQRKQRQRRRQRAQVGTRWSVQSWSKSSSLSTESCWLLRMFREWTELDPVIAECFVSCAFCKLSSFQTSSGSELNVSLPAVCFCFCSVAFSCKSTCVDALVFYEHHRRHDDIHIVGILSMENSPRQTKKAPIWPQLRRDEPTKYVPFVIQQLMSVTT